MNMLGKIHPSQWAAAKAYFNTPANLHALKLSRWVLANQPGVKANPKFHSFIRINHIIYAMSSREYLGSGSYGAVKIIQNEAGENFALKIEQIKADTNLIHANIKKDLELKILKKIKDPTDQKYLKGYQECYFESKKSKNKQIQNDHIEILGHHQIIGKRYTVTSLIPGRDLSKHPELNVYQPIPNAFSHEDNFMRTMPYFKKLQYALQITKALKLIHARGILHGDFKPSNLMYFERQDSVSIFPVDYGMSFLLKRNGLLDKLARRKRSTPPLESQICARLYRAPEVILGNRLTKASDIFSLGVILESDLMLPPHLFAPLLAENPNDRPSCEGVIKILKSEIALLDAESKKIADIIKDLLYTFFDPLSIQLTLISQKNQLHCRLLNLVDKNTDYAFYAIKRVFSEHRVEFNGDFSQNFTIDLYNNRDIFIHPEQTAIIHQKIHRQLATMTQASEFFTRIAQAKRQLAHLPTSCEILKLVTKKNLKGIYQEIKARRFAIEEEMWEMDAFADIPIALLLNSNLNVSITYRSGDYELLLKVKSNDERPHQRWKIDLPVPVEYTIDTPRKIHRSEEIYNFTAIIESLAAVKDRTTTIKAPNSEEFSPVANTFLPSMACSSSMAPPVLPNLYEQPTSFLMFAKRCSTDTYSSYINTEKENLSLARGLQSTKSTSS